MAVARTSFRAARVELSSASIFPEYPTTSAASIAASLRTVRSMALSRMNAPFLAENCTKPLLKGRRAALGLRKPTKGGGWRQAPCSLGASKDGLRCYPKACGCLRFLNGSDNHSVA